MQRTVTININNFELLIEGNYQKREPEWFDPIAGVGDPGTPAQFDVSKVFFGSTGITDITGLVIDLWVKCVSYRFNGHEEYFDNFIDAVSDMALDKILSEDE